MSTTTGFSPAEFRRTLGACSSGITIITARGPDGAPIGLAANSFNTVSLNPPLVLWSLPKRSCCRPAFDRSGHFAVHVLSHGQESLSSRFLR